MFQYSPEKARSVFELPDRDGFEIAPSAMVVVSDDLEVARDRVRPVLALYVGGMGAKGANFYNALVSRYGYESEAREIQELFLDGNQRHAAAAVPDALIDEVALVGPREIFLQGAPEYQGGGTVELVTLGYVRWAELPDREARTRRPP